VRVIQLWAVNETEVMPPTLAVTELLSEG
jgi:hypothetical protein